MYFDLRPKVVREDLFDRDRELELFTRYVSEKSPLVVLTGLRRVGKTSLLLVGLNMVEQPYVYIDLRGLGPNTSYRDLYNRISDGLEKMIRRCSGLWSSIKRYLSRVRGIGIAGFSISLSWRRDRVDLVQLFERLNDWASDHGYVFTIVFDEVQRIRSPLTRYLAEVISYCYDYLRNTVVITSGSEAGLLYRFLGSKDPEHPLYGRYYRVVHLDPLSRSDSLLFLEEGFRQYGLSLPSDTLEYVVDRLDGVIGWLVVYGCRAIDTGDCSKRLVDKVLEEAYSLAISELNHLLETRPRESRERYIFVLKAIARGYNTWSSIKRFVEERIGKTLSDSILYNMLVNLVELNIIEKNEETGVYSVRDPVLRHGLARE